MKINKRLLLEILPLFLISTSVIAYAIPFIKSPVVTVTYAYILQLQSTYLGVTTTLTATLTNTTTPVSGASLKFYHCNLAGAHTAENSTALATIVTNISGIAVWNQIEPNNGIYHYVVEWTP